MRQATSTDPRALLGARAPTPPQRLLLAAALDETVPVERLWQEWCSTQDIDAIDTASFRLLPMVYARMTAEGAVADSTGRLKGIYRYCWFRQHVLAGQAVPAIQSLSEAGCPVLLMKGAALSLRCYRDPAERFMNDIDLMIPQAAAETALRLLHAAGWRSPTLALEQQVHYARTGVVSGMNLRRNKSDIDLHWRALGSIKDVPPSYWDRAEPISWRSLDLCAMAPADLLFTVAVSGLTSDDAHLTWIPDSVRLLATRGAEVDWDTLTVRARRSGASLVVHNALRYLVGEFDAPVPRDVLRTLSEHPVTRTERLEASVSRAGVQTMLWQRFRRVLVRSIRHVSDHGGEHFRPKLDPFCVFRYLAAKWHITHWSEFPKVLARRLMSSSGSYWRRQSERQSFRSQ